MALCLEDLRHLRLGIRVLRSEYGAAVLVGEDGGLEGVDLTGDRHNFLLIHADAGTEYRQLAHCAGNGHGGHGLTGNLTERLTGDERTAAVLNSYALGNAHHKAAHDEREQLLVALVADLLLNVGERHDHNAHAAAPCGQLAAQFKHLLLGALGRIRIAEKVDAAQLQTALGHHPAGNRGVDAAGEQQRCTAVRADRHAARTRNRTGVNKGVLLAHLNVHGQVGMVHVRTNIREQISELAADVLADLCRCHREFLVTALGLDLKGLSRRKIGCQIVLCGRNDTLERLFRADRCTGDGRKAEHTACALHNRICVRIVRNLHINDRLAHGDLAVCNVRHAALEVFQQTVLKGFAVESLEDDLTALEQ